MTHDFDQQQESRSLLERTTLYQEFLAQREEILRYKWLESEKKGRDIGFDAALLDWVSEHRPGWLRSWLAGRPSSEDF
jgi:hypothetical protein